MNGVRRPHWRSPVVAADGIACYPSPIPGLNQSGIRVVMTIYNSAGGEGKLQDHCWPDTMKSIL